MSDLRQRLARLGLSQYYDVFVAEGFDTWDTVLDITESDLSLLNVKLGHRRKLQRAIAEYRGQPPEKSLSATLNRDAAASTYRSGDDSAPESKDKQGESAATGAGNTGATTKRKYRRHPKPDEHAPERPPSAYVIFSNQVRELLKGQDLSFTEIAKVVGERWQVLPADEREACERQANSAKEKYYAALADYKKTAEYDAYQKYLEDFKAKHAVPTKEGKRSKLETETSGSTRSGSYDQDRATNRRLSSVQPDMTTHGHHHHRSGSSPPVGPARLPAGPSYSSKPTSPASHSLSALNSPRTAEHYSPVSASPHNTIFDSSSSMPGRDPRPSMEVNAAYHPPLYTHPSNHPPSTTPPSHPFTSHYQNPIDLPSRRSMRDPSARLPPLTHEDTTWSSESGHSGNSYNVVPIGFPTPLTASDPAKSMRMLPQPVPSIGPSPSPLDRQSIHTGPPTLIPLQSPDYRTQGPLAALVRAGELARVADDEAMDLERSP